LQPAAEHLIRVFSQRRECLPGLDPAKGCAAPGQGDRMLQRLEHAGTRGVLV